MAAKIAVIGAINGQISAVFGKLSVLHAKNKFAFAIIVGDLFAAPEDAALNDAELQQLISGKVEVPLPTYFALGRRALPGKVEETLSANAGELCPNLYFLGRRTTVKTSEGVKIVALGGAHAGPAEDKGSTNEYSPTHTSEDIKVLRGAHAADILVTSEWPADIRAGSKAAFSGENHVSQQDLADLCAALKPRYHFSASDAFLEREPFFHAQTEDTSGYQITRFLSLAPYGNSTKQKWIYAFSLNTSAIPPTEIPAGTTASPLSFTVKKRKALAPEPQSFSRFGNGDSSRQRGKKRQRMPPNPSECFFCLSNANVATHLITSIGNSSYVTTAKGPLSTSQTFPALGFPSHMLIIPLEHSPTLAMIQDSESKKDTIAEMHRYRMTLQQMLKERSEPAPEADKLGAVTWEINRAGGVHIHWQFLPVPRDLINRGLVEAAFKVEAENERYPAFESSSMSTDVAAEGDCVKVTIWSPDTEERTMILPLDSSFRFDLQFGRRVLAKLLGLESRSHWQDCGQSETEETSDADTFKEAFKPHDFSLED
ncbi:hypothetical protein MBLNU459_g6815t1 [Dothideomycetes sp. NU459]